jgi:hypothetical protein
VQEGDLDPDALIRSVVGPLFIAGDAAHVIPPLGGHNLNIGFNDAVNLVGSSPTFFVDGRAKVFSTATSPNDSR